MMNDSVLSRAVGTGVGAGADLGLYRDANGAATTYRPEFAGQTVQLGNKYVIYNDKGYPEKAISVKHAQELGNDYTIEHLGIDQTKIANAGDIYRSLYNAAMENATTVSGSALDNGFGQRNIQYDSALAPEDYDTLIREAVAAGNHVLAGYYEDSRNALIADQGLSPALQTSDYNGGWNWVDSGAGVGNAGAKARAGEDPSLGWYVGQGLGDAEKEYIYTNFDAPTAEEVLQYAASRGFDDETERTDKFYEDLALQMMAGGYVSPETLRRAEALRNALPTVLRNLGMESSVTATAALDDALRKLRSRA